MIVSCARALLSLLLPPDARAMIVRDLDDEYARFIPPSRSRLRATAWYCRQVVGSVVPALSDARQAAGRAAVASLSRSTEPGGTSRLATGWPSGRNHLRSPCW